MKLFGVMVTRDEAHRYLEQTLGGLLEICDRVLVYDDWSQDDTPKIASRLGAVLAARGTMVPSFSLDEALFRQDAWAVAGEQLGIDDGDVVVSVDADELVISRHGHPRSAIERSFAAHPDADGLTFRFREVWGRRDDRWVHRTDGEWGRVVGCRAYRWRPDALFVPPGLKKKIRNPGSVPWPGRVRPVVEDPLFVHLGYARPEDRQAKYFRYRQTMHGHARRHVDSIILPAQVEALDVTLPFEDVGV